MKQEDLKAALEAGGSFVWDLSLPKSSEGISAGLAVLTQQDVAVSHKTAFNFEQSCFDGFLTNKMLQVL